MAIFLLLDFSVEELLGQGLQRLTLSWPSWVREDSGSIHNLSKDTFVREKKTGKLLLPYLPVLQVEAPQVIVNTVANNYVFG